MDTVYLNNAASCYPRPQVVVEAVKNHLCRPPYHPGRSGLGSEQVDFIGSCRARLAELIHASNPCDIVLNSGATESLNTLIQGLAQPGTHVITSATEHNSVLRPLYRLVREKNLELTILDCDANGYVCPDKCAAAVQQNTTLIVVNHCSNVTGAVQDIAAFARIAHAAGAILLVDAAQSAGLHEIDVQRDDLDAVVFAGHKYLYGLPGTGGFYLRPDLQLRPMQVGGTGVRSDLTEQPSERPMLYEAGTPNMPGLAALDAGLGFVLGEGVGRIQEQLHTLVRQLHQGLARLEALTIYAPDLTGHSSMVAFNIDGLNPEEAAYLLENSFGMAVRAGLHCAPLIHECLGCAPAGCVRVSPSVFHTEQDIDRFCQAVAQITQLALT